MHALDIPPVTTLDGELIVNDNDGKPDFEEMSRVMSRKDNAAVSFVAFDVIQHEGKRVTNLPLLGRKELLADLVLTDSALLSKVQFVEGHGAAYYDAVCAQSLEGIV